MLCTVCFCSIVPDVFCRQHLLDIPLNEMGFKCLSVHPALVILVVNSGILKIFYCSVDGLNIIFETKPVNGLLLPKSKSHSNG